MFDALKEVMTSPSFIKMKKEASFKVKIQVMVYKAREKAKMSQQELARRVGTTQRIISNIESGLYCPGVFMFARIAEVLGMDVKIAKGSITNEDIKNARSRYK